MATTTSRPVIDSAIGTVRCVAAAPASTRTRRISSVAYATEESASDEKTARATRLVSRSCRACARGIGGPTIQRFSNKSRIRQSMLRRPGADGAVGGGFLRGFYAAGQSLNERLRMTVGE